MACGLLTCCLLKPSIYIEKKGCKRSPSTFFTGFFHFGEIPNNSLQFHRDFSITTIIVLERKSHIFLKVLLKSFAQVRWGQILPLVLLRVRRVNEILCLRFVKWGIQYNCGTVPWWYRYLVIRFITVRLFWKEKLLWEVNSRRIRN